MSVTVYTGKGCRNCDRTMDVLTRKGVRFQIIDVETLSAAETEGLHARGFRSLPVVVTDTDTWCGFRADKLATLHLDVSRHYNGHAFVTVCACGKQFDGIDPDEADYAALQHITAEAAR